MIPNVEVCADEKRGGAWVGRALGVQPAGSDSSELGNVVKNAK